ncbi:MAG TPA: GlsB/YeaQ/YmgE family stress response membrane protein [Candidatus Limnocylindrales bacterium]|nr:GlsB/YeaQ/YmgE family stress response membrane protein [Candidatus Limnocylindrales bacterium]
MTNIIAWIVLGAIAGLIAGMLVKGDERWGIIGHIVLGIVGALVGGFIANALGIGSGREGGDVLNIMSVIVAVVGAVIVVLVVNMLTRNRRTV